LRVFLRGGKMTGNRASLEELLDDYRDFLRARDLKVWDKDSTEAQYVRKLGRKTPQTYEDYRDFVETRPPEVVANIALGIHLFHGTWSLFQSMGWNNPRFNEWRRGLAAGVATIIVVGNVSFPIAVLAGIIEHPEV